LKEKELSRNQDKKNKENPKTEEEVISDIREKLNLCLDSVWSMCLVNKGYEIDGHIFIDVDFVDFKTVSVVSHSYTTKHSELVNNNPRISSFKNDNKSNPNILTVEEIKIHMNYDWNNLF